MFGLLNLNKPVGPTSRDVVNQVQRIARPHKVGHAGTLDPLASGVLIVCVGAATRLVPYIQRLPKTYRGTFLLGRRSDTEDIQGAVEVLEGAPEPAALQVQETLLGFTGEIMQRPPAYSALKVKGRRAYDIARAGAVPDLVARPVTVHDLSLVAYEYPSMTLDIVCGGGTYVRSLGRDIAQTLGTEAVMSALDRTRIGSFDVADSTSFEDLDMDRVRQAILPAVRAVESLPAVELSADELRAIARGREIVDRFGLPFGELAALDTTGQLVAILAPRGAGRLGPARNFAASTCRSN